MADETPAEPEGSEPPDTVARGTADKNAGGRERSNGRAHRRHVRLCSRRPAVAYWLAS
jgi:hypothetical protein